MANSLSVRRVKFQDISEDGEPLGEPTYGVIAADDYAQNYINIWPSMAELNEAIAQEGCILCVVPSWGELWTNADLKKIGEDNFEDSDWELAPGELAPEVRLGSEETGNNPSA